MTGEYVRDSNGFCIPAGVNEPGELVGEIPDESMLSKYTDANAASKKVFILMLKFSLIPRPLSSFSMLHTACNIEKLGVAWGQS